MADKRDILIRLLGEETVAKMADRAGDGLDRFGKSLDATEKDAKDLDRQIGETEGNLKALAVAFARTSDAADRVDITKAIRRQQTELRKLTKAKDLLPDFGDEGSKSALSFAAGFAKQAPTALRGALGSGPGAIIGGLVAVGLVPTLSAAVAGAVVGGVGLGGVVGGIKLAAKDSRVQAAGKELGDAVMGDLDESASRFVSPTIAGIGIIRSAWTDVADDVDGVFAATARYVEPLARGVGDFVRKVMPGIREAAEAAGPIIREIGQGLPRLGAALGDVMSDFADDADEGASAVRWLFMLFEGGIRVVGGTVHAFAQLYRTVLDVDEVALDLADHLWGWIPGMGGKIDEGKRKIAELKGALDKGGEAGGAAGDKIAGGLLKVGDAADTSAQKIQTWADFVEESTDRALASENANLRLEQAFIDASSAAKENAGAGIKNTEAGIRNRQALLGIAEAAKAASADILKNTGSHDLASKATAEARTRFLATAKAMGVEKGEAIALADKLFGIPKDVKSKITVTANTQPAIDNAKSIVARINAMHARISVSARGTTSYGGSAHTGEGYGPGIAKGGPITGPGPKGVDSVPVVLAPGEHVLTAAEVDAAGGHGAIERMRAMLRGGGGGTAAVAAAMGGRPGGAGVVNQYSITVNVPATANPAEAGRQVVEVIKAYERGSGKGWRT